MRILVFLLMLALTAPAAAQTVERAYGRDARQRLDFTAAAAPGAPLVLFIHGGAWSFGDKRAAAHMAAHFHEAGYAFAAINYRLVPHVNVDDQANDVAAALASLLADARRDGLDPGRIVMIGHSAGAHLAALVGTDPSYLTAHGIRLSAIGIVLLDGAGYDIARQIQSARPLLRRLYIEAFGPDGRDHRTLSPATHAASPNAAEFLILHVGGRSDSRVQSELLAAGLQAAQTPATVAAVDGTHAQIFRRFGEPGHRATELADAFVRRRFGASR